MSVKDDGGSAFPCNRTVGPTNGTVEDFRAYGTGDEGMSLRDYFAAKAMQAMVAGHLKHNRDPSRRGGDEPLLDYTSPDCEGVDEDDEAGATIIAATAYSVADAMLAAREVK